MSRECSKVNHNLDNEQTNIMKTLSSFHAAKINGVIAITTPIPDSRGNISTRTPIYHLPVYNVDLTIDNNDKLTMACDLADMTDLIAKLREVKNQLSRSS